MLLLLDEELFLPVKVSIIFDDCSPEILIIATPEIPGPVDKA